MVDRVEEPPAARREPTVRDLHGVKRVDDYAWLREVEDPAVLAHLQAERAFYDAATVHLRPLATTLASEMSSRVPPTERDASWRLPKYSYYTRTPSGSEYGALCRSFHKLDGPSATDFEADPAPDEGFPGSEQVLLDVAELAEGSSYVELGVREVSPDEALLAYSVDRSGDEVYVLRFRDLGTGLDLPGEVPRSSYGGAWSADSGTFFYTVHDELFRAFQVWRHRLVSPTTDDVLVFEEPDERFEVSVRRTRSGDLLVVWSENRDTSEVWLVDAHEPETPPRLVEPRRAGVEYSCEHSRTDEGDRLLIVTDDGATDYRLMSAPLDDPGRARWSEVVPETPGRRLLSVDAFAGHLVLTFRDLESQLLEVRQLGGGRSFEVRPQPAAGTIRLERNEMYDVTEVVVAEESYTVPVCWAALDLDTGERRLVRRREVPSYDESDYVSERQSFPAPDGTQVPVTLVHRQDVALDGTAPCLLYGYGAYEAIFEPEFDAALTVLLDQGVVFAYAHIRGGGEGGASWWLQGRLSTKQNTFTDHIAVADGLGDGVVDGSRIVTRGLSAGGLLQGAVFSQSPRRWAGVVAEVPFVDVVTTMLDPSIPLTINEWDEWGDPRRPDDFAWMLAYSPYDNLAVPGIRPPLLVTGAVHDARVMVWEPAKWVAALRASDPDWSSSCLFRCETGEGAHAGPSGRFAHVRYEAEIYAWVLDRFGLGEVAGVG